MTQGARPGLTASAKAFTTIRDLILNGTLRPGERLTEEDLTERCFVSRTPVREALRRLAAEGLVAMTPRYGAQVIALDVEEVEEIYAIRAMLEGHAASRAATRIDETQLARMADLATVMERAIAKGRQTTERDFPPANAQFHKIILDAAASPRLLAMAPMVMQLPLMQRTLALYSETDRERSLNQHRDLINALTVRSPDWAQSTMQSHIHAAFHALTRARAP